MNMKKWLCLLLALCLAVALCACGSSNDTEVTEKDDTEKKESPSKYHTITVAGIEEKPYTVPAVPANVADITAATVEVLEGEMTAEGQVDTYTLTPTVSGRYCFEIAEVMSGMNMEFDVKNALGEVILSDWYCANGETYYSDDFVAGETYTITMEQYSQLGTYNIKVTHQSATTDISANTAVNDSVVCTNQRNVYTITPTVGGKYAFTLSEVMSDVCFEMFLYNDLMETLSSDWSVYNEEGISYDDFEVGETYTLVVEQSSSTGSYTLNIGQQTATVDISAYNSVTDGISYGGQMNCYAFTPANDGTYSFTLSDVTADVTFEMLLKDKLNDTIASNWYVENGNGIMVENLTAGETYTLEVHQDVGLDDYVLKIGAQKPTVEIDSNCYVEDAIELPYQKNVYTLTADVKGDHTLGITGLTGDKDVYITVTDENDNEITSSYMYNDGSLSLGNMKVGETYIICVKEDDGITPYTLSVNRAKSGGDPDND